MVLLSPSWISSIALLLLLPSVAEATSLGGVGHGAQALYPHVSLVEAVVAAPREWDGDHDAFVKASDWLADRLIHKSAGKPAPYLVCAEKSGAREALAALQGHTSPFATHPISHSEAHGSCFIVTASPSNAADVLNTPGVVSGGPFHSALKLAPSLLDHGLGGTKPQAVDTADDTAPLRTTFGATASLDNVHGLSVSLSPGVLRGERNSEAAVALMDKWRADLVSDAVDLFATNYWSDPDTVHRGERSTYLAREWRRAATVVHEAAEVKNATPGEICGLQRIRVSHVDNDLLFVQGMGHLLPNAPGSSYTEEVKIACFMGLVSQLAAKPEVLRVSPLHQAKLQNAVGGAVVQSGTITETPLQDAGLDGTGEVIQVVDTGVDETSCFFADDDGLEIEHSYMFDGIIIYSSMDYSLVFTSGDFVYDMSRRKVVQYMEMFKPDADTGDDLSTGLSGSSRGRQEVPLPVDPSHVPFRAANSYTSASTSSPYPEDHICAGAFANVSSQLGTSSSSSSSSSTSGGFDKDTVEGHGTHTAGTAAGSISLGSPYLDQSCSGDDALPGCAGGCVTASEVEDLVGNGAFDIETYCPAYDCDGAGADASACLPNNTVQVVTENSGVAPGAKVAIFDVSYDGQSIYASLAGNGLWDAANGTDAKIHSNSWGSLTNCELSDNAVLYDTFMYENPEHLIIFAAGNDGGLKAWDIEYCTVGGDALGKNTLAVGSSSAGASRAPSTGADGLLRYGEMGLTSWENWGYPWICVFPTLGFPSTSTLPADIDTVSYFSSYGPTADGRIKPEVVAPGEKLFSASSDGSGSYTCEVHASEGTSMAAPLVAGASALVRQYFTDASFYVKDMENRGLCASNSSAADSFTLSCASFPPSAATVKAMLINSANLMGGSSEPNKYRGFGRVELEASMPLNGDGSLVLYVVETTIETNVQQMYTFDLNGDAGLELRATLSWLDVPTSALAMKQLVNDLDLKVTSPSGEVFTMWATGDPDTVNVNERVIVPAGSFESGLYNVTVSAGELQTDSQSYSLVVTGALIFKTESEGQLDTGASSIALPSSAVWFSVTILLILASMWDATGLV